MTYPDLHLPLSTRSVEVDLGDDDETSRTAPFAVAGAFVRCLSSDADAMLMYRASTSKQGRARLEGVEGS